VSPAKKYFLAAVLTLGAVRLFFAFLRATNPSPPRAVYPTNPAAVSEREARKGEQRARIAELLEASVMDMEDREKLDEAKGDARRALRELAHEANTAGSTRVGLEALELEQQIARDARRICSLDAMKKLDAALSALTPEARGAFGERLAIAHRHVSRTCELATK
jgi:Spy/CpxP family protein refolding chaperone